MHTRNVKEKKLFVAIQRKTQKCKKTYTDVSKSTGKKVGLAAVFTNIIRRVALFDEASIHTAKMTKIKKSIKRDR